MCMTQRQPGNGPTKELGSNYGRAEVVYDADSQEVIQLQGLQFAEYCECNGAGCVSLQQSLRYNVSKYCSFKNEL